MESWRVACCIALVFRMVVSRDWLSPQVDIEVPRPFCVICGQSMVICHIHKVERKCEEV